jgi:hypothetical protein
LRRAQATKQSILRLPRRGLFRGACHRAALCADPLARNDETPRPLLQKVSSRQKFIP